MRPTHSVRGVEMFRKNNPNAPNRNIVLTKNPENDPRNTKRPKNGSRWATQRPENDTYAAYPRDMNSKCEGGPYIRRLKPNTEIQSFKTEWLEYTTGRRLVAF